MQAIVHHRYVTPDVLELTDIDKPDIADDEVPAAASRSPRDRCHRPEYRGHGDDVVDVAGVRVRDGRQHKRGGEPGPSMRR
jgi:hypothetical protein